MGLAGILDTNIALYHLGRRLAVQLPAGRYGLSVISEIELLAWPSITSAEETTIKRYLRQLTVCDLIRGVKDRAVRIRRDERLKLPDAIICATAIEWQTELWTNDLRLHRVPNLRCRSVSLGPI